MRGYFDKLKMTQAPAIPLALSMLIAVIAGAIFSFSLSPYGYWWIALLSPALFYTTLMQRNAAQAFWIGLSYGVGLWFVGAFWLYTSIHVYGDTSAALSVLLIAIMAFAMGLFSAVQAYVYRRFFPETPLTFAPIWVVFEWAKTWVFTGFPWLFVGYAFTGHLLDEYAPLFGVFGISFVVVLLSTALVEMVRGKWFWVIPSLVLILGAWGSKHITWVTEKPIAPLSVSLIQGNIRQDLKWLTEYQLETLSIYNQLSHSEWGRDLVVWPESSIPLFQNDVQPFLDVLDARAQNAGSAWVTGIPYWDIEGSQKVGYPLYHNALMAMGADASGLYKKQRLVPFGEYIPFSGALAWVLPALQNDVSMSGFTAGSSDQSPLKIQNTRLGNAICYEVAYPNLTRRNALESDFLVTVSNDAWFTGTAGPWQHLQMVQMRAKENGRWFIRATNTGVTAIIDHEGHLVKTAPQDVRTVLRGELVAMQGQTLYSRLSDWPILIFCTLLLLLGLRYRPRVVNTDFKQRR